MYGLRPTAMSTASASNFWCPNHAPDGKERFEATHCLLLSALRSLRRDDHISTSFAGKTFVLSLNLGPCSVNDFGITF